MICKLLVGTLGMFWILVLILMFAACEHLIPDSRFADRRRDLLLLGGTLAALLSWSVVFYGIVVLSAALCS